MLINEISSLVHLSKKAIRLYESKGLLRVSRTENGYRDYSNSDAEILSKIKLLRMAGISISDIKLFFAGMISIDNLIAKRKSEIENEFGVNSSQSEICDQYMQMYVNREFKTDLELTENDSVNQFEETDVLSLGLDIGTTTISAAIINITKNRIIEAYNIPNDSKLEAEDSDFDCQSAEKISELCKRLADFSLSSYPNIKSIGITGQMHGIVYLDGNGLPISPLYTWQDKRGDKVTCQGTTYCEEILKLTGCNIATGYGFATHYYNTKNGLVPKEAYTFCNITDLVALNLSGEKRLKFLHSSIAASFGLFDLEANNFNSDAIEKLGLNNLNYPRVTSNFSLVGYYREIPISLPIGDNQASFLGCADSHEDCVLVNIGTGSQISVVTDSPQKTSPDLEIRPLTRGKYLLCGCALSGGSSYALLEKFTRKLFGTDAKQYDLLDRLALCAYNSKIRPLKVDTRFKGTRSNSKATGSITEITDQNFTPEALVLGFIEGMCRELYDFLKDSLGDKTHLIASGNTIQKSPVFKNVLADMFKMPVKLSCNREEAAIGTALFSALSAELLESEKEFSKFMKYSSEV